MEKHERLEAVFSGKEADRTPILGGWIACPEHIQTITGATVEEYWADPKGVSIRAYENLGMDGLVDVFVPSEKDGYRCVDRDTYLAAETNKSMDECLTEIDSMPSPEEIERSFSFEEEYASFKTSLVEGQKAAGKMVWMPAMWGAGARASWYGDFGYENYFLLIAGHESRARKLMEIGGATGRCRSRLIAYAVKEGIYPRAVLLGEDICTQRGPMMSPQFLEKHYAPQLRYGLEPLLEVGCKPVWHCDGDVRPILDMVIDCGAQGLQGFQPECGLTLDYVASRRTREGNPLLVFGPLSVTTELPVLSPDEIAVRVRDAIDTFRGKAYLVFFTANTITPDIPIENIEAMCQTVHTYMPGTTKEDRR